MSNTIYLREISQVDLKLLLKWHNDHRLFQSLGPFRFVNMETEQEWFNTYLKNRDTNIRLAICDTKTHQMLGMVSLLNIDRISNSAEFHIFIGDGVERGNGAGYQATALCLHHAFNDQNLHRIYLNVLPDNTDAVKLYKKCGFEQEGILRDALFKNGSYVDYIHMSVINDARFRAHDIQEKKRSSFFQTMPGKSPGV